MGQSQAVKEKEQPIRTSLDNIVRDHYSRFCGPNLFYEYVDINNGDMKCKSVFFQC
jgi:hypothetical protein